MHNFSSLLNITLRVSDGLSVHNQEFKTVHIPNAVCTVLDSWWWTERPKHVEWYSIDSKNCASSWFYYRNISRCTVPWTSNHHAVFVRVFAYVCILTSEQLHAIFSDFYDTWYEVMLLQDTSTPYILLCHNH